MNRDPFFDAKSVGLWEIIISAPLLAFFLFLVVYDFSTVHSGFLAAGALGYGSIPLVGLIAGWATRKNIHLGAQCNSVLIGLILLWFTLPMILSMISGALPDVRYNDFFSLFPIVFSAGLQGAAFFLTYFFIRNIYFSNSKK